MKKVFIEVFILVYYNLKLSIKMKTDVFITVIAEILLQQFIINLLTD